jgi:hypothetical protein
LRGWNKSQTLFNQPSKLKETPASSEVAALSDELVKFEWQEKMMEAVRTVNGCEAIGQPWREVGTLYPSKGETPLVTFTYAGGHAMDSAEPGLIVKFFQEHPAAGAVTQKTAPVNP